MNHHSRRSADKFSFTARKSLAAILIFLALNLAGGQTLWPVSGGGNGHYYQLVTVPSRISWDEAAAKAAQQGGYLATITSPSENAFVYSLGQGQRLWLGAYQPPGSIEPAGGWTWLTGEWFNYTNWRSGEPNNDGELGPEDQLTMDLGSAGWNDLNQNQPSFGVASYIIEYDTLPGVAGGLIAFYPFDGSATDASGNGYHGTVVGANLTADRFGSTNRAYHFGANQYIDVPDMPAISKKLTVCYWGFLDPNAQGTGDNFAFSSRSWNNNGQVISGWRSEGSPRDGILIDLYGATPLENGVALDFSADISDYVGRWTFYAFTIDVAQRSINLYVNGALVRSRVLDLPNLTLMPSIGGHFDSGSSGVYRTWLGAIDEVRVFNRILSSDDINSVMSSSLPELAPVITNQPEDAIATAGNTTSFSVGATSPLQMSYQWYLRSNPVAGGNTSTLTLSNVRRADAGNYSVVVSNQFGSATSNRAALTVLSTPTNTVAQLPRLSCISVDPSSDSLVFITHGETPDGAIPSWIGAMESQIKNAIQATHMTNWSVVAYEWTVMSSYLLGLTGVTDFFSALQFGRAAGDAAGFCILAAAPSGGWKHIHFIAHSAGSALIQEAAAVISAASPSTEIHMTFLDPYVGTTYKDVYGTSSASIAWSDDYFVVDFETDYPYYGLSWGQVTHAFNIDLTGLDTDLGAKPYYCGQQVPCAFFSYDAAHGYPVTWYRSTIPNGPLSTVTFGYPLSKEAGGNGWNNRSQFPLGPPPYPMAGQSLAERQGIVSTEIGGFFDLENFPNAISSTGTLQINGVRLQLSVPAVTSKAALKPSARRPPTVGRPKAGPQTTASTSPAWITFPVDALSSVNLVQFDLNFTSSSGAAGLLTVYWNEQQIAIVDEQNTLSGNHTYRCSVLGTDFNRNNCLSFRLDNFSNVTSNATVSNVTTGFTGLGQSLALSIQPTSGAQILSLTGEQGYSFLIDASPDLVNWYPVSAVSLTDSTDIQFSDPNSQDFPRRFYRAISP